MRTERFTLREAYGGWIPRPHGGIARRLSLIIEVVWFSLVGGLLLRRLLRRTNREQVVCICHNDALAGDVYVNHGVLKASMRARGHAFRRILRNPLHLFVLVRDAFRYRSGVHRFVVALTNGERDTLLAEYPRLRAEVTVIPNGVDIERFTPTGMGDAGVQIRDSLGIPAGRQVVIFVGHEYDRKGLPELIGAINLLPDSIDLLVVGGTDAMISGARAKAESAGVAARVHFAGQVSDPRPYFAAADLFCLPSSYEANALVILEALAMGLPVVTTPVGFAGDVIDEGTNGTIVHRDSQDIASGIRRIVENPQHSWRECARASALRYSWPAIAERYLELAARVSE